MLDKWKVYAILAITVPIISTLYIVLESSWFFDALLPLVVIWCFYPIICLGLYMLAVGSVKGINGVDFTKYTEAERKDFGRVFGLFMIASMLILAIGMMIITDHLVVSLILIGVSMVVCLYPLRYRPGKVPVLPELTGSKEVIAVFAVSALMLTPVFLLSESTGGSVTVEFEEDTFTIRAPMVDKTFAYDEVEDLELCVDFVKGKRVAGYGTPTISSGTFRTDYFSPGDGLKYTLASYAKVKPCVTFWVDGNLYAFNQADDASTENAYEDLKSRLP